MILDRGALYGIAVLRQLNGFLGIILEEGRLWTLRDDLALLEIEPATGRILKEHSLLWRPAGFSISPAHAYVFTTDGRGIRDGS